MSDTVVSSRSWLSRMKSAVIGVVVGLAAFFGSFYLLWWNETNTVDLRAAYGAGEAQVVADEPADDPDANLAGRLIHTQGRVVNVGTVQDAAFGTPPREAILLARVAETYQWQENTKRETREKIGGGEETITTYTYEKVWDDDWIDSRGFDGPNSNRYVNPVIGEWEFRSQESRAERAALGGFTVPWDLVSSLDRTQLQAADVLVRPDLAARAQVRGQYYDFSRVPGSPDIGDQRVRFEEIAAQDATILAQQTAGSGETGPSFTQWVHEPTGKPIYRLETGLLSAAQMFEILQDEATLQMWLIRLGGFVLMTIGLVLILRPLRILGAIIPFFGRLVGGAILIFAIPVALSLSLITIGIAWLGARPIYGIPLLVVGAALLIVPRLLRRKGDDSATPPATTAPQAAGGPSTPPPLPPGAH